MECPFVVYDSDRLLLESLTDVALAPDSRTHINFFMRHLLSLIDDPGSSDDSISFPVTCSTDACSLN